MAAAVRSTPVPTDLESSKTWWDRQRLRSAPDQLELRAAPAPTSSFEYLARTQLDLTSAPAPAVDAPQRTLGSAIVIERGCPSGTPTQPPVLHSPAAPAPASPPPKLHENSKGATTCGPHKGAVAQRLHPHHPFHTEQHQIGEVTGGAARHHSVPTRIPAPLTEGHERRLFQELFGPATWRKPLAPTPSANTGRLMTEPPPMPTSDLPPVPPPPPRTVRENMGSARMRQQQSVLRRAVQLGSVQSDCKSDAKRQPAAARPAWTSKASRPGLFDQYLGATALRDAERQAQHVRDTRASSHNSDSTLRDIEEQLHRVR